MIYEIKVVGLNLDNLLSKISENGIEALGVKKISFDEIRLEISAKEYKKLIDLKISSCYNISILKKRSKHKFLSNLLFRLGIVVGIVTAAFFLSDFCSRIWEINVLVDDEINEQISSETLETLGEMGISIGSRFESKTRDIEKQLSSSIETSSMVVAERDGIKLNIFIKEREFPNELSSADLVASHDGVIKEIKFGSGILVSNVGEAVVKGQVLIASGIVGDIYNEAVGEIIAKTLISGDAVGSTSSSSYVRSGKFVEISYLELFGKKFYCDKTIEEAAAAYLYHEIEIEEKYVFENNLVPIKKCTARIYELNEEIKEVSNAELVSRLKEESYKIAKNKMPDGAKEERVSYDVFADGELYRVVCNISTTINIAVRKEKN